MTCKAGIQYQHKYVLRFIGSQLNAISLECVFEINPTSIRTFKGCNLAGFTVFKNKGFLGSKLFGTHPLHDVLHSYIQLTQHECSSLTRNFEMIEESMSFFRTWQSLTFYSS